MVGDPVRVVGADVGDAELFTRNSESSKTFGPSSSTFGEMRVPGQLGGHGIQLAHHAHAGAGGRDDNVVTVEDLDKAPHQRMASRW